MSSKPRWKHVVWGALCLVVIGAVAAPFFLPPGFGAWFVSEQLPVAGAAISVTFSPDGEQLAVGNLAGTVHVWEMATGQLHQTLGSPGLAVTGVAFSPTRELLAASSQDGVHIWEMATGQLHRTLGSPGAAVTGVVFSSRGESLAASSQGSVDVWEVATGQLRQTLKIPPFSSKVAFSPTGELLAWGSRNRVDVWEVATGQLRQTLEIPTGGGVFQEIAFSPTGELLAWGSRNRVDVWEVATGQLRQTLEIPVRRAPPPPFHTYIAFNPTGELLATSRQGRVDVWEVATGQLHQTLEEEGSTLEQVMFSPIGKIVASWDSGDGTVHLWSTETGKSVLALGMRVVTVAASANGRWVAAGQRDGTVYVWEAATMRLRDTFRGRQVAITCLTFSQDDKWVITWDQDSKIRSWAVDPSASLDEAPPIGPQQCLPPTSGRFSLASQEGGIFLYDAQRGFEAFLPYSLFWVHYQHTRNWLHPSLDSQHVVIIPPRTVTDMLWGRFRLVWFSDGGVASASVQPQVPLLLVDVVLLLLILVPGTVWMASHAVRQRRLRQHVVRPVLHAVQRFLEQAGVTLRRAGERSLRVVTAPGRLTAFVPLPVVLATDSPDEADVADLVQHAERWQGDRLERAGILIYREPPDALVRLRMAEVRLRNHVALIPIPLAEVEEALRDNSCAGLLAEYANRYLPGADLFDDRLAISDMFTFFGREQLLHRLQEDLLKLQGVGLFGLRKSGKTSVLLQLGFALRHHPVVRCDLQFHSEKPRFGADLFSTILQQLTALVAARRRRLVPRFAPLAPDLPAAQLAVEFAQRVNTLAEVLQRAGYALPILCFLDEVERILPARTDPRDKVEEFNACFGALRALSQERHILALLVADVHPDCNRINQWAHEGVASNPVYNFFKEVFLPPFSETDTTTMLTDLGRFMGRTFDESTLQSIHRESGGHPYVARQLASLVCARIPVEGESPMTWSAAQRYVERSFNYSDTLKNYCDEGIWGDLQKRHFTTAMTIVQRLACSDPLGALLPECDLRARLGSACTESQWLEALLWLEAVGLVAREESADDACYQLRMPLLARWLRMQMGAEEVRQWQIR